MRFIYLSDPVTILLCFVLWPVLQIGAALLCLVLPDSVFSSDNFLFRDYSFENGGAIYQSLFRVRSWKNHLPDGGKVWDKNALSKTRLDSLEADHLQIFLIESSRAELTHWLAILPFWVFAFFTPPIVPWIMLVYALIANLPCIIAQRFNRPRVHRLLLKINK